MADIKKGLKDFWIKGMEALGNTASNLASNTKYKVNEMNMVNRRREILNGFGAKAYELWQKGVEFPAELETELQELSQLDIQLNELRMEHLSNVETGEVQSGNAGTMAETAEELSEQEATVVVEEEAPAEEETVPVIEVPEETAEKEAECPLSDAINELFETAPSVKEMAGKVNSALDSFGNSLKEFGKEMDQNLNTLGEKVDDILKDKE